MNAGPVSLPTDEQIAQFARGGVVLLRGAFDAWVEPLRAGVRRVMADPGPLERTYRPSDGAAPFFQDFCNWTRIAEFHAFVFESPAAAIAARLMRSRTVRFFHDHVLVKEPGSSTVTPWHQDQPYYCIDGRQTVSFWTPLDVVSRDLVMQCVVGSHLWPALFRPRRFDGQPLYARDDFTELPDIDARRDEWRITDWELNPGDTIAFSFRTVHGAPANRSTQSRRVFSSRWVGDDAVFAERGGPTSPPFPGLRLRQGDALDVPEFPLVYVDSQAAAPL
jgi:ectoine hydroxylase-related dioxygenase (phytanoyl-CoA dioxygenase family)